MDKISDVLKKISPDPNTIVHFHLHRQSFTYEQHDNPIAFRASRQAQRASCGVRTHA